MKKVKRLIIELTTICMITTGGFASCTAEEPADKAKQPKIETQSESPATKEATDKKTGLEEGVAAEVNNVVITKREMDKVVKYMEEFHKSHKDQAQNLPADFKKEALERLIERELLYQEAKKGNAKADTKKIDEVLASFKKQFKTPDELKKYLETEGISEEFIKADIERQLLIQQFLETEFANKIKVSKEEIDAYSKEHPESKEDTEQLKASHILIKVDPKASEKEKKEARKKIEDIQEKIKKGGNFEELAKEYSQCPSASRGGDLGFFGQGQMVKPFNDAVFKLKPGELSGIVETEFGLHIIKLMEKRDAREVQIKQEKVGKATAELLKKLKETAKIKHMSL